MPLHLTFLGTGGAFTDFRVNYHNNALIWTDAGPVLVDCGGTAPQALRELGLSPRDLAGVVITHCHGDHVGGLEQLVWERFYGGGPAFAPTPVHATEATHAELRQILEPLLGWYTRPDRTVGDDGVRDLLRPTVWVPGDGAGADGGAVEVTIGGVHLSLHATPHVSRPGGGKPCYGLRARADDGAELYFTSDTEFRADLGARFPDADAVFHDTTFLPWYRGTVHTHWTELQELPASVRSRTVLMHHTAVPEGVDPVAEGFAGAADRFDTFEIADGRPPRRVGSGAPALPG